MSTKNDTTLYCYIISVIPAGTTVSVEPYDDWTHDEGGEPSVMEAALYPAPDHIDACCMRALEMPHEGETMYIGTDWHGIPVTFNTTNQL